MGSRIDWGPSLVYWVEDGKPDPDVDWPSDWEVCQWPDGDPLEFCNRDKRRHGKTCLAMPMYSVPDPTHELERICSFLERMPDVEREKWLALQDRQLTFSCSDPEIEAAEMERHGFHIPGQVIRRVCTLRLRLMIGFHPASKVISNVIY
jgi:hypothetical protein